MISFAQAKASSIRKLPQIQFVESLLDWMLSDQGRLRGSLCCKVCASFTRHAECAYECRTGSDIRNSIVTVTLDPAEATE